MGGSVYEPITRQNHRENKLPTKFLVFSASLFDMKYEKLHFSIYIFSPSWKTIKLTISLLNLINHLSSMLL